MNTDEELLSQEFPHSRIIYATVQELITDEGILDAGTRCFCENNENRLMIHTENGCYHISSDNENWKLFSIDTEYTQRYNEWLKKPVISIAGLIFTIVVFLIPPSIVTCACIDNGLSWKTLIIYIPIALIIATLLYFMGRNTFFIDRTLLAKKERLKMLK